VYGRSKAQAASSLPIAMITSKVTLGHAEPAAGVVGVLHLLRAIQQAALPPLIHLQSLNPFVSEALAMPGSSSSSSSGGSFHLPRQLAPRIAAAAAAGVSNSLGLTSGVSSFAFQGTNAHLMLAAASKQAVDIASLTGSNGSSSSSTWQRSRQWFMAAVNPLLSRVLRTCRAVAPARGHDAVHFQGRLASPSNAALLSSICNLNNTMVLPAAAALMVAAAAVDCTSTSSSQTAVPEVLMLNAVFGQLMWPQEHSGAFELTVALHVKLGDLAVTGSIGGGSSNTVMAASVAQTPKPTAAAPPAAGSTSSMELPAFLTSIIGAAQAQHGQLPSPVVMAQVAAAASARSAGITSAAMAAEPEIAAVLQLESSWMLPYVAGINQPGLAQSIESAILNPRGFGPDGTVDLVDPDMPDPATGLHAHNFWLRSPTTTMQLQGLAYISLADLAAQQQPAAATGASAAAEPARQAAAMRAPAAGSLAGAGAGLDAGRFMRGITYRPLAETFGAAAAPPQPLAVEVEEQGFMYAVEWLAANPADAAAASTADSDAPGLQLLARGSFEQQTLQVLQGMQRSQAAASQMNTGGAFAAALAAAPAAASDATAAMPWAMLRSAALENPQWQLVAADAAAQPGSCSFNVLPAAPSTTPDALDVQHLYGNTSVGSTVYTAKLVRAPTAAAAAGSAASTSAAPAVLLDAAARRGTFIITGGGGAVGVVVARWLAVQLKVQHIHFVSRSGALPVSLADLLAGSSSTDDALMITASKADVSTAEDARMVCSTSAWQLPIRGLMHAAGVLQDSLIANQSLSSMRAVLGPKTAAAQHLLQQLQAQPAAAQVLFSSVASLLGSPGQANYAAANAGLDAAAHAAAASGLPCVSVQYGAWAGSGMAGRDAQTAARAARLGIGMLQPDQALAALSQAVSAAKAVPDAGHAVLAAVPITWRTFLARLQQQPPSTFFSNLAEQLPAATAAQPAAAAAPAAAAREAAPAVDTAAVKGQAAEAVAEAVSTILGTEVRGRYGQRID
jgi:short-subunit dehydrogenase